MTRPSTVAIVRSDNRRGAVAEALALIADDVRSIVTPEVVIKANLVSHQRQLPSTHADTLSATLDAILGAGAHRVTIAEGASDASAGFDRFGFRRETFGRPVAYFDINRDETNWDRLQLTGVDGSPLVARLSRTIAGATCRVSLALMKTHVTSMVTFSLKNMLSSIHPDDRIMMHGHAGGGNGYRGWKKWVVEFLKGDSTVVNALTRSLGRVRRIQSSLLGKNQEQAWRTLKPAEIAYLRSVEAMNRNLVALSNQAKSHLSVVDGFIAMHREGPRHGTPIKLGTIVASTDAVAVDAVAAAVMGFDPLRIGYLKYAQEAGLGVADLDRMTLLGDPLSQVRRACVPHSNHAIQRHWDQLEQISRSTSPKRDSAIPAPHSAVARASEHARR
jgi:uncharacterized protein (DUF362 family)